MQLEPYLFFNGNCETALAFYGELFGGTATLNRYAGSPLAEGLPPDAESKIMHSTFHSPAANFMASDNVHGYRSAGNVSLSLATNDEAEARRVFTKLADGGNVTMPLQTVFWGGVFGTVTDAFGIAWMVSGQTS